MSDDTSQRDESASADEIAVTPEIVDAGVRCVAEHRFAFVLCDRGGWLHRDSVSPSISRASAG